MDSKPQTVIEAILLTTQADHERRITTLEKLNETLLARSTLAASSSIVSLVAVLLVAVLEHYFR
jgi:hypothetical protein